MSQDSQEQKKPISIIGPTSPNFNKFKSAVRAFGAFHASQNPAQNFVENQTVVDTMSSINPVEEVSLDATAKLVEEMPLQDVFDTLPVEVLSIDSKITKDRHFSINNLTTAADRFRSWHVETLLNQAADLLERGIRDRQEFNSLRAHWCKLVLEVREFEELRKIHKKEIAAGWYGLNFKQSEPEWGAEVENSNGYGAVERILKNLLQKDNLNSANIGEQAHQSVILTGYSLASNPGNTTKEREKAEDAARTLARMNLETQAQLEQAHLQATTAAEASSKKRMQALEVKKNWDENDQIFRSMRSDVALLMNVIKKAVMYAPDGAYNYAAQMELVRQRFLRDFQDSYSRLMKAKDGLEQLYAYYTSAPKNDLCYGFQPSAFPELKENEDSFFDQCLLWTRDAIRFMVAFGQLEQNYVFPVSVKDYCGGDDAWTKILQTAANGSLEITFDLPESLFPDQYHVRLRGITAFVVEKKRTPGDIWRMELRPPKYGYCRRLPELAPDGKSDIELDQHTVPTVTLGRVMSRESVRDPDIVGIAALHNISPIGAKKDHSIEERSWKLTVDTKSLLGTSLSNLKDIHIDLLLAMRAPTQQQ